MITEAHFQVLYERAMKLKYSSFGPLEYNDCIHAEILQDADNMILLIDKSKEPIHIYWAAENPESVLHKIDNIKGHIYIDFIPADFVSAFQNVNFSVWAEFVDFFNNDLVKTSTEFKDYNAIQFLQSDETSIIKEMSTLCVGLSRGFCKEKEEWFYNWVKENDIIIIKEEGKLIGYCCVSIYANGTILWVRRIAVNPVYQRKGYGRKLIEQAIVYGINKGAIRGFLHADILNNNAISLYNKYNFYAKSDRGEIQMIRK